MTVSQPEIGQPEGSPNDLATPCEPTWPTATDIADAARLLAGVALRTPLVPADALSALTGHRVFLKAETLQRTGSYKLRGAYVRMMRMSPEQRARGVVCASAGNHGQGVALAARLAGTPVTVVLPRDVPVAKLVAVRAHGARVILAGDGYDEAYAEARRLANAEGLTFVHPFDDWDVIAGQATVGAEILEDRPDVDAIVVPVGGGGLLAGIALATRAANPVPAQRGVKLFGVQAAGADAMAASFAAGKRLTRPAETVADGIKVREPGERTFAVIRKLAEAVLTVAEDEIYQAVVHVMEKAKLIAEPAGAVGVAALLGKHLDLPPGSTIVVVLSGANVDPTLLNRLTEYGLAHAGRYLALRALVPDRPGHLVGLLAPLADLRVNVLSIEHHRTAWGHPVVTSEVLLHLETRGPEHCAEVVATLRERGFVVEVAAP